MEIDCRVVEWLTYPAVSPEPRPSGTTSLWLCIFGCFSSNPFLGLLPFLLHIDTAEVSFLYFSALTSPPSHLLWPPGAHQPGCNSLSFPWKTPHRMFLSLWLPRVLDCSVSVQLIVAVFLLADFKRVDDRWGTWQEINSLCAFALFPS